jgi:hypothetical protein
VTQLAFRPMFSFTFDDSGIAKNASKRRGNESFAVRPIVVHIKIGGALGAPGSATVGLAIL